MGGNVARRSAERGARRRRTGRMTEINITPVVDVVMVLLIIFMVAAPMLTVGVPVELPRTAAGALPATQQEPLSVTLTADGALLLMETEVNPDDLLPQLRAIAAERTDNKVFLRAAGTIPYERVVQVMGALNAGGFNNIGLVTEQGGPSFDGSGN